MKCILVRNVVDFRKECKILGAECNSFNMKKKNVGDLASVKTDAQSNAKKHPLECKVTTIEVQSIPLKTA